MAAHAAPTPPTPDPLAALQAQVDAQQVQINTQAAQIAELHSLLFLSAPEISSNKDGTGSARVAKSQLAIAPDAWEFITSMASSPDPNLDLTGCTSLGVLMGSDDDGDWWSKPVINTTSNVMLAARYRINGLWSPYSIWVLSEL